MSPTEQAARRARGAAARLRGIEVFYQRGEAKIQVTAVPREPEFTVDGGDVGISHLDKDWSIVAHSLVFSGRRTQPQRGDRISQLCGSEVYEVLPLGKDECFRPIGSPTERFRIHTKRIQ